MSTNEYRLQTGGWIALWLGHQSRLHELRARIKVPEPAGDPAAADTMRQELRETEDEFRMQRRRRGWLLF